MKRKTKGKKFHAALKAVGDWCKRNRHAPLAQQHCELSAMVRGHYAYYGIRGNSRALANFREEAKGLWHFWLSRRSRERKGSERLWRLLTTHLQLPAARIVHTALPHQLAWSLPT